MLRLASYLGLLLLAGLLTCCTAKHAAEAPQADGPEAADRIGLDSNAVANDALTVEDPTFSNTYYCASPVSDPRDLAGQALIGERIPDLEDSTLLTLVYGSCNGGEAGLTYNWGPQMWNDEDSVYMHVAERLGNDSVQIIYLRGDYAITTRMHNHFVESAVMLVPDADGWRVVDAYVDATAIDFEAVLMVGKFKGRLLRAYATGGTYAGGVLYESQEYMLLEPRRLRGPSIAFTIARSNSASEQCYNFDQDPEYHCDCYEGAGKVEFVEDPKWDCMRFSYTLENQDGDCEMASAKTTVARQTWLMSADTAFQIAGDSLSDWSEGIVGQVNLSGAQIKTRLQRGR